VALLESLQDFLIEIFDLRFEFAEIEIEVRGDDRLHAGILKRYISRWGGAGQRAKNETLLLLRVLQETDDGKDSILEGLLESEFLRDRIATAIAVELVTD